jgi:hypothetical protein
MLPSILKNADHIERSLKGWGESVHGRIRKRRCPRSALDSGVVESREGMNGSPPRMSGGKETMGIPGLDKT